MKLVNTAESFHIAMKPKTLLLFLVITTPVFSKHFESWEDRNDAIPELTWLLNTDGKNEENAENKFTVCDTKECKIIAAEFKRSINKSVDPCNDFYEYVCGKWKAHNPIPPYAYQSSRIQKFQGIVFSRIKEILETSPALSDILPVRQAKKWYQSCMNTEALEKKGLKPLDSILVQTGGWPMTMDSEEWSEDEHTWQSIEEHYLHITGGYVFYRVSQRLIRDTGIKIFAGKLPLDNEIEFKYRNYSGNDYNGYIEFIAGIIETFIEEHKADVSKETMEKDIRDMVEFEKKLYLLEDEYFDSEETTIDEFIEMYDNNITEIENENIKIERIDFRRIIRRVFDMVQNEIEDSTPLYAYDNVRYWLKLTEILNETPKRTIVNYIHWHFVSSMMKYTTNDMRELIFQHNSKEYGITAREPRWMECVSEMEMTSATSYAFTQKYFHKHTEEDVQEMIKHIRSEMKSQIDKTSWLDEGAKKLAVDKLEAMKVFLGYPDWYKNQTFVLNSYKGLTIGSDYFGNVLSYRKYKIKRKLRRMPSDESSIEPTIVNAFYSPYSNSIELPAADFQPPLFTSKLPRNINYGMAGVIIGHEIGHGFDDDGITIDKDGNETQLSKHMIDMYFKRAECFLDQFNEYWGVTESNDDGATLNYYKEQSIGRRTRGENIADSTGLHAVFEAYRKMIEKLPNGDYRLPGFEEYTDNQMFFVSFGVMWCENVRPKFAEEMAQHDSHSPARLRVIGSVSNTNDFARAFNCPKGTGMNPDDKCDIWKSSKMQSNIENESEDASFYKYEGPKWHGSW